VSERRGCDKMMCPWLTASEKLIPIIFQKFYIQSASWNRDYAGRILTSAKVKLIILYQVFLLYTISFGAKSLYIMFF